MNKTSEQFQQQAIDHISKKIGIDKSQMFVVWYAKELQNHKALISFHGQSKVGDYIEVTYNGDKNETYYDFYQKVLNEAVTDEGEVNETVPSADKIQLDGDNGKVVIEFDDEGHSIEASNVDVLQLMEATDSLVAVAVEQGGIPKSAVVAMLIEALMSEDGDEE